MNNNEYTMPEFVISVVIMILLLVFNTDARALAGMGFGEYLQKYRQAQASKMDRMDRYKTGDRLPSAKKSSNRALDLSDEFVEFLKYSGIYSKAEPGKMMVIYINFDNPDDTQQAQNIKNLSSYKNSPDWTKSYTFVEYEMAANGELRAPKDVQAGFGEFVDGCQNFCIVDLESRIIFKGNNSQKGNADYLYSSLAIFYR